MGNLLSPTRDTVVLVPPRISTRGLAQPIVLENPMSVAFGNLFRGEVLNDLHSFNGQVSLDVLMCPEFPPTFAAHLSLSGSSGAAAVKDGSINLQFNEAFSEQISGIGRLSISGSNGLTGYGMLSRSFPDRGVLSITANLLNKNKIYGLRAVSKSFRVGCEVPRDSLVDTMTWAIARLSPHISVGFEGRPFGGSPSISPCKFSICLDKQIDKTDSSYSVSGSVDYPTKDVTLGFSQHLVTHRRIYNPLEEKHVKFIANYIDIAVEGKTRGESFHDVSGGVSWQLNKNLMAKLHASTSKGAVITGVVRNWWVPSVLGSVSVGVDPRGKFYLGGRLQVSNWLNTVEYQRGQPVSELPQTNWIGISDVKRFNSDNSL